MQEVFIFILNKYIYFLFIFILNVLIFIVFAKLPFEFQFGTLVMVLYYGLL